MISVNVKGIRDKTKRLELFNYFRGLNCDYVCLQETHSDPNIEKIWIKDWGGDIIFSHGTTRSSGVALLLQSSNKVIEKTVDTSGRYVIVKLRLQESTVVIAAIYSPNTDNLQVQFYNNLYTLLQALRCDDLIVMGDFNLVLEPAKDKKGGNVPNKKSNKVLSVMVENLNLIDVWRKQHPTKKQYTWSQKNPEIFCRFLLQKK